VREITVSIKLASIAVVAFADYHENGAIVVPAGKISQEWGVGAHFRTTR
jgi:hypothetical protein